MNKIWIYIVDVLLAIPAFADEQKPSEIPHLDPNSNGSEDLRRDAFDLNLGSSPTFIEGIYGRPHRDEKNYYFPRVKNYTFVRKGTTGVIHITVEHPNGCEPDAPFAFLQKQTIDGKEKLILSVQNKKRDNKTNRCLSSVRGENIEILVHDLDPKTDYELKVFPSKN